ncbi:hypothetical protein Clacol_006780 [Clathrus columnatus]|uniref:Uncharacterized protein n=1 Tax=Clathrus columnatus TaxID=1419009 RepID=A0AAV5AFV5_9AGAM|nr:hypothetical protein Clacol_006780 [Clathrus columnatus]
MFWIWIHLLQFCVSNQSNSPEEDAINKSWRPIPAGRISLSQTKILRYYLCAGCLALSLHHNVLLASILICLSTTAYNDLGLHRHMVWRNLCNAVGYASFELGATQLAGSRTLPISTIVALVTSSLIIFTTIQAADFRDEKGDRMEGKLTLPIAFPELSRVGTSLLLVFWSNLISTFWSIDVSLSPPLLCMAFIVACRFYRYRNPEADRKSYLLYNSNRGWREPYT